MFFPFKPSTARIEQFVSDLAQKPFSYAEVGASSSTLPENFTVDHNRVRLGSGEGAWKRAVAAINRWEMFNLGWTELCWPSAPIRLGTDVAVLIRHFGFYSLNGSRIVYVMDEESDAVKRYGFAYGTLTEHAESGEERFMVEWDKADDAVYYDLLGVFATGACVLANGVSRGASVAEAICEGLDGKHGAVVREVNRRSMNEATFTRKIGKWSLTGLVINAVVGSALFGMSGDLVSLLGRASVLGVVAGGIATAIVMACFAEVASKFPQPGGSYIYARTTFGRLVGIQVGWFSWLVRLTSAAASATIFVSYLGGLFPSLEYGLARAAVITIVLGLLTAANYIGVRSGANVSSVFAIAKLTPLLAIGIYGAFHASGNTGVVLSLRELAAPGAGKWFEAFLLMSFLYGGFDTAMMPLGEVKDARRSVPFALAGGLVVCIVVFTLVQIAVLSTAGAQANSRPLSQAAAVLFGPVGATLTSIAAMISTYGYLSAGTLSVPRLTYALAEQGDFPRFFAKIHPRFHTPHVSIVIFGVLTCIIAVTGSFKAAVVLSVGARLITYLATCAAVIPLRRSHPERKGFDVPFAPALSVIACVIAGALITRVHAREAIALGLTATIATASWCGTRRKEPERNASSSSQF